MSDYKKLLELNALLKLYATKIKAAVDALESLEKGKYDEFCAYFYKTAERDALGSSYIFSPKHLRESNEEWVERKLEEYKQTDEEYLNCKETCDRYKYMLVALNNRLKCLEDFIIDESEVRDVNNE